MREQLSRLVDMAATTMSVHSPTSHMPDGSLLTGNASCFTDAAKRLWLATLAMTESIQNGLLNHSRSSHWRAG